MSTDTVTKFKLFWADQDAEQEQWLGEMARQGLHLKDANIFFRWTFVKGEPAEIAYRMDYRDKGKNSAYQRLFEDAGWECAAEVTGCLYWRKPVVDGRAPEIFSDIESTINKHQRALSILASMIIPMILTVVFPLWFAEKLSMPVVIGMTFLNVVAILLCLDAAIRLRRRIRRLRNAG